ncbi:hypothetical protein ACYPKM_04315 [Pseudomonas aeruginosa]
MKKLLSLVLAACLSQAAFAATESKPVPADPINVKIDVEVRQGGKVISSIGTSANVLGNVKAFQIDELGYLKKIKMVPVKPSLWEAIFGADPEMVKIYLPGKVQHGYEWNFMPLDVVGDRIVMNMTFWHGELIELKEIPAVVSGSNGEVQNIQYPVTREFRTSQGLSLKAGEPYKFCIPSPTDVCEKEVSIRATRNG